MYWENTTFWTAQQASCLLILICFQSFIFYRSEASGYCQRSQSKSQSIWWQDIALKEARLPSWWWDGNHVICQVMSVFRIDSTKECKPHWSVWSLCVFTFRGCVRCLMQSKVPYKCWDIGWWLVKESWLLWRKSEWAFNTFRRVFCLVEQFHSPSKE